MLLNVLGISEAVDFEPPVPTYAIRIFNTERKYRDFGREPLISSPNYKHIQTYEFDDIDQPQFGKTCFSPDIARKILDDFKTGMGGCEMLMVQCTAGQNRSPAVALALNQIFSLDNDSDEFYDRFPELNRTVYVQCLKVAEEIGLGTFEIYGHPQFGTDGQMLAREQRLIEKARNKQN